MKLGQSRPVRSDDAVNFLRQLGQAGDGPHDIARAALMLAALDHANRSLDSYLAHLDEVAAEASREAKAVGAAEEAIQKLIALLRVRFGYDGDRLSYDDPRNADLIEVIERRRGLPVALGILFLHAARAAGYTATGLSAPVHFLVRISTVSREAILDPFNGNVIARDKLFVPPVLQSAPAANVTDVLESVSDTDVLIRLLNNVKLRASEARDQSRAITIAERMVIVAPKRAELWLELARLNDSQGGLRSAREAYETCLSLASPGQAWHNEAALALASLKRRLN